MVELRLGGLLREKTWRSLSRKRIYEMEAKGNAIISRSFQRYEAGDKCSGKLEEKEGARVIQILLQITHTIMVCVGPGLGTNVCAYQLRKK